MKFTSAFFLVLLLGVQSATLAQNGFNLNDWKSTAGQRVGLKQWNAENPKPWRNYYATGSAECARQWYISLGPLGLTTRMHDRTWGVFEGCRSIFPKALTDSHGLVFNAFEVVGVKSHSPAHGQLEEGDLIVGIDGEPLLAAQHTFLDQVVDNKQKRGLEIHAGQLIDRAEGRGEIELIILRLPASVRDKSLSDVRAWKTIAELKLAAGKPVKIDVPLSRASIIRLSTGDNTRGTPTENLVFRDSRGKTVPLLTSAKKEQYLNTDFEVPSGNWNLTGTITSNNKKRTLTISALPSVETPRQLTSYLKTVRLKLDRIGSFGDSYNPDCDKVKNYSAMLAHRLATQQEADGSWTAGGYASKSFHTSVCGLALLSTGDPAYKDNIRRAARYVAHSSGRDKWTYSNGMWMVFLAEYYLRTQDQELLPAIRMHVANLRRFIMSDYTGGHSDGGPGYGGSGYIGGGGVVALGLAIASHTPAASDSDKEIVDKMLQRVQEIAPRGRVPYGRIGGGHQRNFEPEHGQGGSCGTGPYYLASRIRGGAELFTTNAARRYSTAPYGSAENGHATQTLHFVWACLSSAITSDEAHRDNMNAYLWKFTTLRECDGFINKNNYRTEYHNGDGVIGEPYWRTAGYLLILNAHKKNLALTGAPAWQSRPRFDTLVLHHDQVVRNELVRNWAIIDVVLGTKAPAAFRSAFQKLRSLPADEQLGTAVRALMKRDAPPIARSLLQLAEVSNGVLSEQLVELLLGLAIQIECTPDFAGEAEDEGVAASIGKKKQLKKNQQEALANPRLRIGHTLNIVPVARLQTDPNSPPKETGLDACLFPVRKLVIEVSDPTKRLLPTPARYLYDGPAADAADGKKKKKKKKKKNGVDEPVAPKVSMPLNAKGRFRVHVEYTIGGIPIDYSMDLPLPAHGARNYAPALAQFKVQATPVEDYCGSYTTRLQLQNGVVIGCEHRNQPVDYMLAGQRYGVTVSPGSMWGHDLRSVTPPDGDSRQIAVVDVTGLPGPEDNGYLLTKGTTLTMKFARPTTVGSAYLNFSPTDGEGDPRVAHQLEAWMDGKWTQVSNRNSNGLLPTLSVTTDRVRLRVSPFSRKPVRFHEVLFFSPAQQLSRGLTSW